MLSQSLRAARLPALRAIRQQAQSSTPRALSTSAVRKADQVQDIYLKALRDYKPTPPKAGDADAHVQKFAAPSGFKSPEEADLASELSSYESQSVETEGQSGEKASASHGEPDWFETLEDYEAEEKQAAGGH